MLAEMARTPSVVECDVLVDALHTLLVTDNGLCHGIGEYRDVLATADLTGWMLHF